MQTRKLALDIAKIYKRDNNLKTVLSGIMFGCLISHLKPLTVLGKKRVQWGEIKNLQISKNES